MMELAYKKVKTAIINMFHMLRSIQEKTTMGGGSEICNYKFIDPRNSTKPHRNKSQANGGKLGTKNLNISCQQVRTKGTKEKETLCTKEQRYK